MEGWVFGAYTILMLSSFSKLLNFEIILDFKKVAKIIQRIPLYKSALIASPNVNIVYDHKQWSKPNQININTILANLQILYKGFSYLTNDLF